MTIKDVAAQKIRLDQKKARFAMEETKLKLKERKMRTKSLIQQGGLITKAGLDHLPTNALYGVLLSIKKDLDDNENLLSAWIVKGNAAFNDESKKTTPIILKFDDEPNNDIRAFIRSHGLRFNRFRSEWYGNVAKFDELKNALGEIKYNLEVLEVIDS
tara:strand:- start:183 stop:656 length:474 start_codon:yes stop_codon:yes gene_type:complete